MDEAQLQFLLSLPPAERAMLEATLRKALILHPQNGPQTEFLESKADITIFGGARGGGKTYGLLLSFLKYTHIPQFVGVLFRRNFPQIAAPGGPWVTSCLIYPHVGAKAGSYRWRFPSGSSVEFHHLMNPQDWQNWLGSQVPYFAFDQLETFTEEQFFTMLASNRDPYGIMQPRIGASCNPEPDTWLSRFISWWWDQDTGYPIAERSGKLRWFVRIGDRIAWADDPETLRQQYKGMVPKSVTFIPSYVTDNKVLLKNDPAYMSNLMAQNLVNQERWIRGNWKIKPAAGLIFNRSWFAGKIIKELPVEIVKWVRYWDLAATAFEEGEDPDWTAGALIGEYKGRYYIKDVRRFRKSPKETEDEIRLAAKLDGIHVSVRMEEEAGASGKSMTAHFALNVLNGYAFQGIPSRKNKLIRWQPMASCLQAGNLYLLEGEWNAAFIDELDACQGLDEKNDQADAASGAFNCLATLGPDAAVVDHRQQHERVETVRYDRRLIM